MKEDEWNQLVERQRQRKSAMTPQGAAAQANRPVVAPGDVGWVIATAAVQSLIEHGVFTDEILSRVGELMLAAAQTRAAEGRQGDADAIRRAAELIVEGTRRIRFPTEA